MATNDSKPPRKRTTTKRTATLAPVPDHPEEPTLTPDDPTPDTAPPADEGPDTPDLDSVVTDVELTVPMVHLISALTAVVAHAERPKLGDEELRLSRVRVIAGAGELLVMAQNLGQLGVRGGNATAAYASVEIDHDSRTELFPPTDGPFVVDVHPAKVRDLIAGLKPKTVDKEKTGTARVRLRAPGAEGHPGSISVTDVSGLWPGQVTKRPTLPLVEGYPDVIGIVGRALAGAAGLHKPLVATTSRFDAAAKAYGEELMVQPTGTAESRGFVVVCGPRFAGTLESRHPDGDNGRRMDAFIRTHLGRLGVTEKAQAV